MSQVRIQIRSHQLATAEALEEVDDGVFIALPNPPPVRSILRLEQEGKDPQALEVVRVIELEDPGSDRRVGLVGKYVGLEALRVPLGTEHLESGVAASGEDSDGPSAMAVPAPVVDPDPSDAIDVDELERLEASPESDGDAETESDGETDDDGQTKKKKRRGRKRR